jgi:alkylation response protein AidB-like acyl-CoA dehydrogenase
MMDRRSGVGAAVAENWESGVDLTFTEEQDELRASVRRFLGDKSPSEAVRRWMESAEGYDPALWQQMAGQLGLQGLAVPEEFGGAGYGPVELGIVLEEMGRVLVPAPFLATVALAGQALTASDDPEAQARWLPGIADGSLTATVAFTGEHGGGPLASVTARATPDGADWRVSGTAMFVVDGATADLLLVVARADEGLGLYAVEADTAGVSRSRLDALDPTRRLGRIDLDGALARRVGPAGDAGEYLQRVLDLAVVALAHEQVGGASACLDASVGYAKIRVQFNRPIGSFQAIKHKCADLLLEVEAARSAVYSAAWAAAEDPDELATAAAVAGAWSAQTYAHAAKDNIQIHGGIGFTWEHDAHLHLKRAKSTELLFGTPVRHRARLADLVGI